MNRWILLLASLPALAQPSKMRECGLGKGDRAHPCHCIDHTSKIQNDYVQQCLLGDAKKSITDCVRQMPQYIRDHCIAIEQHGDWHMNEAGEHDQPMPDQCQTACLKGHCRCDDGPVCHIQHQPEEDEPQLPKKHK